MIDVVINKISIPYWVTSVPSTNKIHWMRTCQIDYMFHRSGGSLFGEYKLVGVVLLWAVYMRNMHYALFIGISYLELLVYNLFLVP